MPTTIDNHALIFALIVFFTLVTIGLLTQKASGRKTIQRQREEWARTGGAPEHAWLDDSASLGANIVCFLWCAAGGYLGIAILWGNLFWLEVFIKAL